MYRAVIRSTALRAASRITRKCAAARRFASTEEALKAPTKTKKKGTWRWLLFRWALAVGVVYWYNTSPYFADDRKQKTRPAPVCDTEEDDLSTLESVIEAKKRQIAARAARSAPPHVPEKADKSANPNPFDTVEAQVPAPQYEPDSAEAPEHEANQQGAFNPETGEINWDCPCLGGMADGPCGDEFKTAFSCFVHSTEEPKGMDCIDKFTHMQECFQKYPEIYGAELEDNEQNGAEASAAPLGEPAGELVAPEATKVEGAGEVGQAEKGLGETVSQPPHAESDEVPRKAVDAIDANTYPPKEETK